MSTQDFCIDSSVLGTTRHLVKSGTNFSWSSSVPEGHWHLSGDQALAKSLDAALRLDAREISISPGPVWINSSRLVFSGSLDEPYPWELLMPKHAHRAFVKSLVKQTEESITAIDTNYYEGTWVPSSTIFDLMPAKVNMARWAALMSSDITNRDVVQSFAPDERGYTSKVVYNRFGTRTGRLTVTSGPQILTLNRDRRDIIESAYGDDGVVLALDCNALEARVLFYEAGHETDANDLYSHLASTIFDIPLERKVVKGVVIAEMYGMSKKKLAEKLDIPLPDAQIFIKVVKKHMKLKELLVRLRTEMSTHGFIRNRYGRKLIVPDPADHVLINTFAQSTGVDVGLLAFTDLLETLRVTTPSIRPIFLLHDALIIDIKKSDAERLQYPIHCHVPTYREWQPIVIKSQPFMNT